MTPIGPIVLIDDAEPDNYLHRRAITRSSHPTDVVECRDGDEALRWLHTQAARGGPAPSIILLDLNMPAMTGWEFLDRYAELPPGTRAEVLLVLSTSVNPADAERAANHPLVAGFIAKPLTSTAVDGLIDEHLAR